MAYIIPGDMAPSELTLGERRELELLNHLKKKLPPAYIVYHNVHWSAEGSGDKPWNRILFGEGDFLIVNPAGHILMLELKAGALKETASGLVKPYPDGDKNAAAQITRTIERLRKAFSRRMGRDLILDYILFIPDHTLGTCSSVGLDPSRIVDSRRAEDLVKIICDILPASDPVPPHAASVFRFLENELDVVVDVGRQSLIGQKHFIRLNGGLCQVLRNLEMTPMKLRVEGSAGSGKSLLAVDFYRKAVAVGKRPLLLCFNRPLAERLRADLAEVRAVNTWHGFCSDFLGALGRHPGFEEAQKAEFWQRLAEEAATSNVPDDWKFDTLIIDEAQDFDPEWLDMAQLFLREGADILIVGDEDQNIFGREAHAFPDFVTYRARENFRTPFRIAAFIQSVLGMDVQPRNPVPGDPPQVLFYEKDSEQPQIVAHCIREFLRRGFRAEDIVVLSLRGHNASALSGLERVGPFRLRKFTDAFENGRPIWSAGDVQFDSIWRFKGQQAPAVILTDVAAQRLDLSVQRLLYVALTRATVSVNVLAKKGNAIFL